VVHIWREGAEMDLMHRAMGFAALGLVTLVPLLIVVAAADPLRNRGFAFWLVDGMGLPSRTAVPVERIFSTENQVLITSTDALSLAALAVFGLSFVAAVQAGYETVWCLPAQPWHQAWRRVGWLAALTAYLAGEVQSGVLLRHGMDQAIERIALTGGFGVAFFWWGQHFLLAGRVSWRSLLPGAVATMIGLGGLRAFSYLVFSPLIISNAASYGAVGIVLVVESWLIGVGFVFYGGPLVGRHIQLPRRRDRALADRQRPQGGPATR
jgi:membrane protein